MRGGYGGGEGRGGYEEEMRGRGDEEERRGGDEGGIEGDGEEIGGIEGDEGWGRNIWAVIITPQ